MMYNAEPEITEFRVLQANLTPLPNGTTVTTNIASHGGFIAATLVISFTVSPLVVVVVAQANSNGRESVPSDTYTLLKQFAAPIIASTTINPSSPIMNMAISHPLTLYYDPNIYRPLNMIVYVDSQVTEVMLRFGEPVSVNGVSTMQYTGAPTQVRYFYYGDPLYSPSEPNSVRIVALFPRGETLFKVSAFGNEYGGSNGGNPVSYTF
jgi:hypothetical protein